MNKTTVFTGCAVAIVTPMNPDGSVNYAVFADLIEEQITQGTNAIVVCGTTGEASTLTDSEHYECIRFAVEKTARRVPVIAGTGSNDTAYMVELSKDGAKAGADALLLTTPYYNKASQRGLVASFTKVANEVNLPIILYNIPGRTCVNIELDTFAELAKHPNIVAVKESGGNIGYMAQILERCGDSLEVYSGDDAMTVPAMAIGAKGVVSVAANIAPKMMSELCKLCLDNDFAAAGRLQIKYTRLFNALLTLDVNPVPVKAALNILGKNAGPCRMPLYEMDTAALAKLKEELRLGLMA